MIVAVCCLAGCAGTGTDSGASTSSVAPGTSVTSEPTALSGSTGDVMARSSTPVSSPSESSRVPAGPAVTSTAPPSSTTRKSVSPSDEITGVWVLGSVQIDSAGPCYELRADDGRVITMYSSRAGSLAAGERIRARTVTPVKPIYCGSTEALRLLETKPAV